MALTLTACSAAPVPIAAPTLAPLEVAYPGAEQAPTEAVADVTIATLTPEPSIAPTLTMDSVRMVTPTKTPIAPTLTPSPIGFEATVPAPIPPTPSDTPSPTPEIIPDVTVTPIVRHLNELEPVVQAASFRGSIEWSPDSRHLLYRVYSWEELAKGLQFPEGDLHAYSVDGNNTLCGEMWTEGPQPVYFWLGTDLAYVNEAGGLTSHQPCGDSIGISQERIFPEVPHYVVALNQDGAQLAFQGETSIWRWDVRTGAVQTITRSESVPYFGGVSWSPDGRYVANSTTQPGYPDATTAIVEVQTRQVLQTIEWGTNGGLSDPAPPVWLSNTQFLLDTWNQGPLLGTVGGEVVPLAPQILGERMPQINPQEGSGLASLFIVDEESGTYHVLFMPSANNVSISPLWLYHSETGEVEELPFADVGYLALSPNEEWLALQRPGEWNNGETTFRGMETWARLVDPPGSEPRLVVPVEYHSPSWSPDWTKVVVRWETGAHWDEDAEEGFAILSSPHGTVLQRWQTDVPSYLPVHAWWSPDGKSIALVAADGQGESLFILPIEP